MVRVPPDLPDRAAHPRGQRNSGWRTGRIWNSAGARSGVAPEYLAAILGVETYYGRQTGNYRVLDALATLAFDYPARAKFFRDELEQFILLARDMNMNPLTVKGSYAGAMGAPQFMPSNYRRYAVDADGDGRIDLWNNWPDVCASVGNYLKEHGWNPGEPVLSEAASSRTRPRTLDGRKLALADTVGSLQGQGRELRELSAARCARHADRGRRSRRRSLAGRLQ